MTRVLRLMPGAVLAALLFGCAESSTAPGNGGGQVPPPAGVLLQDIVIPNLPSPYYHFDYDSTGRVAAISFASDFTMYTVTYQGNRIIRLQNNTLGNQDRLEYAYDGAGRVTGVNYVSPDDSVFTKVTLMYAGAQLIGLERQRLHDGSFLVDKTMTFSYYADGNLELLTEHRPAIVGFQPETTTFDHFEQYDDRINVDGFTLLHNDFFDHLVFLPGVQLQNGNPGRVTHTGDGTNYRVDNVYAYDDQDRPLTSTGDLVILNGADAGRHFQTQSQFTYY